MPASKRDESTFPGAVSRRQRAAGLGRRLGLRLLQAMLGILPDAPRGKLYIDPLLPHWLPDLTLHDLRLGKHVFDIRFWRDGEDTKFEVLRGDPQAVERSSFVVQSERLRHGCT